MKSTVGEDRALLSRCFSGDREAEETLVRQYSNLVYSAVQRTLMMRHVPYNSQDLEDLHNTIFLRLFEAQGKKLRQYQGKNGCSLATWIRTVAVRTVLEEKLENMTGTGALVLKSGTAVSLMIWMMSLIIYSSAELISGSHNPFLYFRF